MALVEVGALADLPDGEVVSTQVGGRDLVLIRWGDDVYALRNICPHMSTRLTTGTVMGHCTGTPGEVRVEHDNPVIACPWHKYEFSLTTGRCLTSAKLRIRSYPVTVDGGTVLVDLSGHRTPSGRTPE